MLEENLERFLRALVKTAKEHEGEYRLRSAILDVIMTHVMKEERDIVINYFTLAEYADKHGLAYNSLCALVRDSVSMKLGRTKLPTKDTNEKDLHAKAESHTIQPGSEQDRRRQKK